MVRAMSRKRILVLAGGESGEHEVSIVSARSVLAAIAETSLEATAVVITRRGQWLTPQESERALADGSADSGGALTLHQAKVAEQYDAVFPLIHGPHGEDGTLQGMLELAGVPYVGSGVLSSALCMDKAMSKAVLTAHGLPQIPYELITQKEFEQDTAAAIQRCAKLQAPWFIKPANLGSSVGMSRAENESELEAGIREAIKFDRRVVVEHGVSNARELEIGIIGNDDLEASTVGEITFDSEWYDYETKYTDGKSQLHIPAQIPPEVEREIRELALKAYRVLDCAGFARIDFFYSNADQKLVLNEVNTIPGFTPFSMFTKLWAHSGLPYPKLVEKLVDLAIERRTTMAKKG